MMRMDAAGRIDIGVAHHEFFQDVVLNGSAQLLRRHALLFGRDNVERHDRQHRAIHGHRHRHVIERNLVEQDLHVEDRIDGHAGLADVAGHALVVGVVAAMRGEIEGDREALSVRRRGCGDRTRSILPRWRSPRTAGSSTAASRTWCCRVRADRAEYRPHIRDARARQDLRAYRSLDGDVFRREPLFAAALRTGRARCRAWKSIFEKSGRMISP